MLQEGQLSFLASEVEEYSDAVPNLMASWQWTGKNIYRHMSMTDASRLRHALHGQNLWSP